MFQWPITTQSKQNNKNNRLIVEFYKILKKYNEIQLTFNNK